MQNDRKWWWWLVRLDTALLLVALVAGSAGAVLSVRYLGARAAATEASLRSRYDTKAVVVAAANLAAGESLDATRLAVRRVPKEFLPEDAVPAERASILIGGRTAIPMQRGTPVVTAALHEARDQRRLSSILNGERRALTISVDEVNSQAGNLQPGDWVDLYYSRSTDSDSTLVPLLQRVEILATGVSLLGDGTPDFDRADGGFSTITLGLSAEDAARVVLAQQTGNVSVVLRAPGDTTPISLDPRSSRDLLRPARKSRAAPEGARIEVLVGGSGELLPTRTWMAIGQGRSPAAGDAS
jgi:pilus assembly protein CpaB